MRGKSSHRILLLLAGIVVAALVTVFLLQPTADKEALSYPVSLPDPDLPSIAWELARASVRAVLH